MQGVCSDSGIEIIEEDLENAFLIGVCKVMMVHGVMPIDQPIKLIKTFTEFARICIFPFVTCISEVSNTSDTASYIDGGPGD